MAASEMSAAYRSVYHDLNFDHCPSTRLSSFLSSSRLQSTNHTAMPPTISRIREARQLSKNISFLDPNSQLALVPDVRGKVLPESRRDDVHDPKIVDYAPPALTVIAATPSSRHKQHPTRLTQRDDSAVVPVTTVRVTVVPHPPPPYTPPIPLRASRFPPMPLSTNTDHNTNGSNTNESATPAAKIALIIAIVILSLLLGLAIVREAAKRRIIRRRKDAGQAAFRSRLPKFPNVRGQVPRGMESLSWNMENRAFEETEMATHAEFDDRTWGAPMLSKNALSDLVNEDKNLVIPVEDRESPVLRSQNLPWLVPTHRSSCPPALDNFAAHQHKEIDQTIARAMSMSLSMGLSLSQVGPSMLATIKEESMEFVRQEVGGADDGSFSLTSSVDASLENSCPRQPNSRPLPCDLFSTKSESDSISTILTLTAAGMRSAGKRGTVTGRTRQGSDASRKTDESTEADTDYFSDGGTRSSSNTSVATMASHTDDGEESEVEEVFELKRVTDSMEVKKGILLSLVTEQVSVSIPKMPKVVVRPASSETLYKQPKASSPSYGADDPNEGNAEDRLLQPTLITKSSSSSLRTLESVASGASIDLDDFPSPPASPLKHSTSITFTLCTDSGAISPLFQ